MPYSAQRTAVAQDSKCRRNRANKAAGERRRGGRWCGWACLTSQPHAGGRTTQVAVAGQAERAQRRLWSSAPVRMRTRHPGAGCGCRLCWGGG